MRRAEVNGVLVLYAFRPPNASTIVEHYDAFRRHSRYPVYNVNVFRGFPAALKALRFSAVVLHYSIFNFRNGSPNPRALDNHYLDFLYERDGSYRVAFFQDEYRACQERFAAVDNFHVDCVYTLVEPRYFPETYGGHTNASRIVSTIPGLVADEMVAAAAARKRPDDTRRIDVGYRGRELPGYLGRAATEKVEIADEFVRRAEGRGLALDVATAEADRLYGDRWWDFLSDTRISLGVEAGASIFDLEGEVSRAYQAATGDGPEIGYERFRLLCPDLVATWEGRLDYRTVSPRAFEAAAFCICPILFEGSYSNVLEPWRHYLPLRKDFSNFEDVLAAACDPGVRERLTRQAYDDLIASRAWSYARFVADFDDILGEELSTSIRPGRQDARVLAALTASQVGPDLRRRVARRRYELRNRLRARRTASTARS